MRRLNPLTLWVVIAIVGLAVVVAGLAWFGTTNPNTQWASFVPDLIVGIVTAALVGAVLAWVQHHSDERRRQEDRISAAYANVLEATALLRAMRFDIASDASLMNRWSTRLIQLTDVVDHEYPDLPMWFEAERQLGLDYAWRAGNETGTLVSSGQPYDADDVLQAGYSFFAWATDFGDRVRYWRTGKLRATEMRKHTMKIEGALRERGVWRDEPEWRKPSVERSANSDLP